MVRISVCIPTYNGEKFIKEQLDSIITQLGKEDEIIISDDSSTDGTISIIESYSDTRIKLLPNNNFKSPIFNLENALIEAKGDYIFLSDQDDIWLEKKVETILAYFDTHNLIVSDCYVVDSELNVIYESFHKMINARKGFFHNLIKNGYLGCAMAFKRKILEYVLPFPRSIAMHDIWIGLNAEIVSNPVFINEKLIYYRRHGNNMSPAAERSNNSLWYKIYYRIIFIVLIVRRLLTKKI